MDTASAHTELRELADISFRLLLKSAAESILIVDQCGQILWANDKTCELFGYNDGDLLGQKVELLIPEGYRADHQEHRARFASHPRNRPMGEGRELLARRNDGSTFPVEISLSLAGAAESLQVMTIITDITSLKQAEQAREWLRKQQLEQKEEEIRTLERLSRGHRMAVTAKLLDLAPLKQYAPTVFEDLVQDYNRALEIALEMRIYKTDHPLSEILRPMAERISFLKGTPRDVIDIHRTALQRKSESTQPLKVRGYFAEGHLLLVELMGYLAARYRDHAIAIRQPQSPAGMP